MSSNEGSLSSELLFVTWVTLTPGYKLGSYCLWGLVVPRLWGERAGSQVSEPNRRQHIKAALFCLGCARILLGLLS